MELPKCSTLNPRCNCAREEENRGRKSRVKREAEDINTGDILLQMSRLFGMNKVEKGTLVEDCHWASWILLGYSAAVIAIVKEFASELKHSNPSAYDNGNS